MVGFITGYIIGTAITVFIIICGYRIGKGVAADSVEHDSSISDLSDIGFSPGFAADQP